MLRNYSGSTQGPHWMLGIDSGSAVSKARVLPPVLSLWPQALAPFAGRRSLVSLSIFLKQGIMAFQNIPPLGCQLCAQGAWLRVSGSPCLGL